MNIENVTTETLKAIYAAAREYCIAAKGFDPSRVELYDDGTIYCCDYYRDGDVSNYCCVEAKHLTADLLVLAEKRRIEAEMERERLRILQAAHDDKKAKLEKIKRRVLYNELKKEFEAEQTA